MFISEAMAASDAATAQSPMAGFFIQLILVFVIFYFYVYFFYFLFVDA